MELIGFLKRYHSYIEGAEELTGIVPFTDKDLYNKIISYLESGDTLLYYMELILDDESNTISPLSILTDGYWIWPSYFYYYLERYPNNEIYKDFVTDIVKRKFTPKCIEESQKKLITDFYLEKAGTIKKEAKSTSLVKQVRPKIKKPPLK
jgi:hypothetical protein